MGNQVGPSQLDRGDVGQEDGNCRTCHAGTGGGADWVPNGRHLWPHCLARTKFTEVSTKTVGLPKKTNSPTMTDCS